MNATKLRPSTLREAHDAMREGEREGLTVVFRGSGTASTWGAPVEHVGAVIDTTAMNRVVAYNPADMTLAVGAGARLWEIQQLTAAHGQWLGFDPPREALGATIGGLLATGEVGPRALSYGPLRDLVIGVTVVLADGAVARSGGHVIKNVAGYDVAKLMSGSLGTLGLIAEVVLRLHPRPQAGATVSVPADASSAFVLANALVASQIEPAAIEWDGERLFALFEGTASGVAERTRRAVALAGGTALGDDDAQAAWTALRAGLLAQEDGTTICLGTRPDLLGRVGSLLGQPPASADLRITSSVALGLHTINVTGASAQTQASLLAALRDEVEGLGGSAALRWRAPGVDELLPAWGSPPSSVSVMRRVKEAFDADNRCAPGRFAPWF